MRTKFGMRTKFVLPTVFALSVNPINKEDIE
ncbi:Uncharacterised protein [Arcanobacterium haemolyticum]|nr:Uncharacterised protein [Arcanobacterium haemolyticum]